MKNGPRPMGAGGAKAYFESFGSKGIVLLGLVFCGLGKQVVDNIIWVEVADRLVALTPPRRRKVSAGMRGTYTSIPRFFLT